MESTKLFKAFLAFSLCWSRICTATFILSRSYQYNSYSRQKCYWRKIRISSITKMVLKLLIPLIAFRIIKFSSELSNMESGLRLRYEILLYFGCVRWCKLLVLVLGINYT